ncbi:MAG: hypothetical protein KDA28_02830, partial [Phycisphaerales bacterium]|nr:hypothetical protein [Phycisphaerales bacterium]
TLEEHTLPGGFGHAVLESIERLGLHGARVQRLGLPDAWIEQDPRGSQLTEAGLDVAGIRRTILTMLSSEQPTEAAEA